MLVLAKEQRKAKEMAEELTISGRDMRRWTETMKIRCVFCVFMHKLKL